MTDPTDPALHAVSRETHPETEPGPAPMTPTFTTPPPETPPLTPAIQKKIDIFAELLPKWNERINLVSPRDIPNLRRRHIEDSLQLAALIPPASTVIDLGSGGGFPGLIVAMATGNPVTLVESDQRKCAFLREAARLCGVAEHTRIVADRIEAATPALSTVDYVTARALAPLPVLLGWAAPLLKPGGKGLFLKGQKALEELTRARADWHMIEKTFQSRTDPSGIILEISDLKHK